MTGGMLRSNRFVLWQPNMTMAYQKQPMLDKDKSSILKAHIVSNKCSTHRNFSWANKFRGTYLLYHDNA
eukprot:scaffold287234_cov23-Prasinocladus_malaysianus.AAC.1